MSQRIKVAGLTTAVLGLLLGAACLADEVAPAITQQNSAWSNCVATCADGTQHVVGQCLTSQTCCGWYNCTTGSSQNTCCNPGWSCNLPDPIPSPPPTPRCKTTGGGGKTSS